MLMDKGVVIETVLTRADAARLGVERLQLLARAVKRTVVSLEKRSHGFAREWDQVGMVGGFSQRGFDNNDLFVLKGSPPAGMMVVCWMSNRVWGYDADGSRVSRQEF